MLQMSTKMTLKKVNIVYHHFPHYRAAVLRELAKSEVYDYRFFGGTNSHEGIEVFKGDEFVKINPLGFSSNSKTGRIKIFNYWQAVSDNSDAIIIIGNPNIRATWIIAIVGRVFGKKIAFWAHGWIRPEKKLKAVVRNFYYNLGHQVLVYGNRAKKLAVASGFPESKVSVIYNSLDWEIQNSLFNRYENVATSTLRERLALPENAIILTAISRVTPECEYDLLIEAVSTMQKSLQKHIVVVMIGSGSDLLHIKELAKKACVDLRSTGAIYDEEQIAMFLMASDVVVSPGKVGLTAMHSLAYGTPVVTHNNLDRQMPEVEAILDGQTGALFDYGSKDGLIEALIRAISLSDNINKRRTCCRDQIVFKFNPKKQCELIDRALKEMLHE